MRTISVFDTTINDYNLGNQIIMDSVYRVLRDIFPCDFLFKMPYQRPLGSGVINQMKKSDYAFFGGTNSLSSNVLKYNQMGFRLRDLLVPKDLILFGVGWWQYQEDPSLATKIYLKRLLSNELTHSVRDEYTKNKLVRLGVKSVVNTCCPTTWELTPEHCSRIPTLKADAVVTTLTDYSQSRDVDEKLLAVLFDNYQKVYYWVQGVGDYNYIQSFKKYYGRINIIPPWLEAYDNVLASEPLDYIGTRLHAGIRAIQRSKRALVLSVDNRAAEISKDINLNAIPRDEISGIENFIAEEHATKLNIPFCEIEKWKIQFVRYR